MSNKAGLLCDKGGLRAGEGEVAEVGVGRIGLQAVGDVVVDAGGELHLTAPLLVASAVGKEGDATATEAVQLVGAESAAAGSGQPQVLRLQGGHDEGGFLALDEAHTGVRSACEQVLAEEALVELPVGRQQSCADEGYVRPPLESVAVAVGAVVHDVTAVDPVLTVYLPEDDVASAGGAQLVVVVDLPELLGGEVQTVGHAGAEPLPEDAVRRVAATDVLGRHGLEGRQRVGLAVAVRVFPGFGGPLVVAVVFRGFVVVAAGVLVVALAHRVGDVLECVACVYVAHQALLLVAVRTSQLHGLTAGEPLGL